MSDYLDPENEELLKDFFVEAELQVEALESNFLALENNPTNSDAIDEIFRAAHTLKGAAATVQMNELADFTHLVEDVLDAIRDGRVLVEAEMVDLLLQSIDVIKDMLAARSSGGVYQQSTEVLCAQLQQSMPQAGGAPRDQASAADRTPQTTAASAPGVPDSPDFSDSPGSTDAEGSIRVAGSSALSEYDALELREAAGEGETVYQVDVQFNRDNPMNTVGGIQVFAALKKRGRVLRTLPDFEALYEDTFYPTVTYFVASGEGAEPLRAAAEIPDVTTGAAVQPLEDARVGVAAHEAETDAATSDGQSAPEQPGSLPEAIGPPEAQAQPEPEMQPVAEDVSDRAGAKNGSRLPDALERKASSSVLRVDSKRVDNLLNLVSETVINKAGFNQLIADFNDALNRFDTADQQLRDVLKSLFDSLPEYLEQMQNGSSVKQVRKELMKRFGGLYSTYDDFESGLKTTVTRFRSNAQNLGRIAGELQEGVMRIRMVPIAQIFSRFPRLVRDLSRSLNKNISLQIEGEETELDKSVIEDLLDPLIHCVRNSIDHGVESAAQRLEAGKPEAGTVKLKASNEGNMIVIEVSDDGRGIDVEKVRARAIERGIIHGGKSLTDLEAFNLIFEPGFSTAAAVTNVSGRGVGLDVVKRQLAKLSGSVSVWSELGVGTRFTIKIPLTLAIIQGLLVRVGKEMYAIPISSVIESHRIRPGEIKRIDNYEVFNVRDDVVSLLRLNRLFHIETDEDKAYHYVVIVGTGEKKMGLVVDSLIGEEDVVIKPLRDHYTNAPGIAGANVTGDGTVCLIIDVGQLLDLGLKHEMEQRKQRETTIG